MKYPATLLSRCVRLYIASLAATPVFVSAQQIAQPEPAKDAAWFATDLNYQGNAAVGQIVVGVARNHIPADGQTSVDISVQVLGRDGKPIAVDVVLTVQASGGRLLLPGAKTDELGAGRLDADRVVPGTQLRIAAADAGKANFKLIAPVQAQDVKLSVSAGAAQVEGLVSFVPQLRDWVAAGVIEGIVSLRRVRNESAITPVRVNDGFEDKLRNFEREFNSGKASAAARAAFFVKGTIKGEYLLTASYDSDKETRARMLRDVRPDQLYPVFGDASIKTYEAQSSQRLYVRVDHGKNYVLYGDFNTGAGFANVGAGGLTASLKQRDLGNYSRSLSGVRWHQEWSDATDRKTLSSGPRGVVNAFVSRDSLSQRVEDIPGNGTSGPFGISRSDAIENTEKIEIIVRDRNNPGNILSAKALVRYEDYTFDPFSGRILLKGPLSSTDSQGNLQSLRVTYEVDQGGDSFWVYGADAQWRINDVLDIGGSIMSDKNPGLVDPATGARIGLAAGNYLLKDLISVNVGINPSTNSRITAEAAHAENDVATGAISGQAMRLQGAWHSLGGGLKLQAQHSRADKDFYNPGASINLGRREASASADWTVNQRLSVQLNASQSEDHSLAVPSERRGVSVGANYVIDPQWTVRGGLRHVRDNGSGLYAPGALISGASSLYSGTGLAASGGGFLGQTGSTTTAGQVPGYATLTGTALETTTANVGVQYRPTERLTLDAEAEHSVAQQSASRVALGARWQVLERTALNARYETQTGLGSYYDRAQRNSAFVLGVTNDYQLSGDVSGQAFGEYRLRDSLSGREAQLATGLRNTIDIAPGWRTVVGLERVRMLSGGGASATALALGLDYSGSDLWRGSTRLELRHTGDTAAVGGDDSSRALLHTMTVARKIDRSWTGLASHFYTQTDTKLTAGHQTQQRIQLGAAYRPVDRNDFDALMKLETRRESNTELASPEQRRVWVGSMHGNWHPSRPLWVSGRFATKQVDETLDNAVRDQFSASLLSGRVIYDLTEKWDVSAMASVMSGQGNRQKAYGLETGYALATNVWLSVGYNWAGFRDRDLTGSEYTAKGAYLRLRFKFDEKLWRAQRKDINMSLER